MKTRIFLILAVLFAFGTASHAQATKSIPLGKKGTIGLDTRIPAQASKNTINAAVDRRIAAARAQAQARAAKRQASKPSSDWLTKEDIVDEKDYVVTPAGNIKKGSWEACEYFANWEKRQFELNMPEEQFESSREMVFLQFDISNEYCQILAQQRQIRPVQVDSAHLPSVAVIPSIPADLHINVNPDVTLPKVNVAQVTEPIVLSEKQNMATTSERPKAAKFSWLEVRNSDDEDKVLLPHGLTPRKAKRYLKHFVRDNYDDLTQALRNQKEGTRLNVGQRRLLTSYDSLCSWYKDTHPGEACPDPESFL